MRQYELGHNYWIFHVMGQTLYDLNHNQEKKEDILVKTNKFVLTPQTKFKKWYLTHINHAVIGGGFK